MNKITGIKELAASLPKVEPPQKPKKQLPTHLVKFQFKKGKAR